jgi:predicted ATP-grasp superfamily ATP-dependent carboligase
MAFRLLQMLVLSPPRDLQPTLQLQLGALIRESLGESAHYRSSVDKTVLPQAAEALGVRVPPWAIVTTPEEAEAMTSTLGFPLVLKRGYGFAGEGVAICSERAELHRAFSVLSNEDTLNLEGATGTRLLAQAHVPGGISYYGVAAWKGALLAGYATDKVVANPEPKGPATVLRYHRAPEIRGFAEKLARGFGMSGLFSLECIVHERTGESYLLEINRRIAPGTFRGGLLNVDMCAALRAALDGLPSPSRSDLDEGECGIRANFPQEWLRDPGSRYLRDYPVDVPWDDPELIEAMLALRHEA